MLPVVRMFSLLVPGLCLVIYTAHMILWHILVVNKRTAVHQSLGTVNSNSVFLFRSYRFSCDYLNQIKILYQIVSNFANTHTLLMYLHDMCLQVSST